MTSVASKRIFKGSIAPTACSNEGCRTAVRPWGPVSREASHHTKRARKARGEQPLIVLVDPCAERRNRNRNCSCRCCTPFFGVAQSAGRCQYPWQDVPDLARAPDPQRTTRTALFRCKGGASVRSIQNIARMLAVREMASPVRIAIFVCN